MVVHCHTPVPIVPILTRFAQVVIFACVAPVTVAAFQLILQTIVSLKVFAQAIVCAWSEICQGITQAPACKIFNKSWWSLTLDDCRNTFVVWFISVATLPFLATIILHTRIAWAGITAGNQSGTQA